MADLAALLDREASAEIEAITAEARERASALLAKAEEEATILLAQSERTAEAQHAAELVRAGSAAQLEAASLRLKAQQQAIEGVFAEVEARLGALAGDADGFRPVLTALFKEALAAIGAASDVREVVVAAADSSAAAEIARELGVDAPVRADAGLSGGVRLLGQRNVTIENSLTGRLDALRDDLASSVAQALMGGDGA